MPTNDGEGADSSAAAHLPTTHDFLPDIDNGMLATMTNRQKGLIIGIRSIRGITEQPLLDLFADEFPPGILFHEEIGQIGGIWTAIRDWLAARGVLLQPHGNRRIILTLANGLYTEAEDRNAATELANLYIASTKRRGKANSETTTTSAPQGGPYQSQDKLAHNIAMRFKDGENKFGGDIGECWQEFADEYRQVANDYGLTEEQKFQYLHNILKKDAQRYYLTNVKDYAHSFDHAINLIDEEYNSIVRQNRVKNYLNSLRITDFISSTTDEAAALSKVYKAILKLSRQVPLSHRGDAHRIEFLRRAVLGQDWARDPLSRIATNSLSFQALYGELDAAAQLDKESKLAAKITNSQRSTSDAIIPINFSGQGRYRNGNASNRNKKGFNPLSITGCFNCGDPHHRAKQCPKPPDHARMAAKRIEYLKKKKTPNAVHVVLAYFCDEMDDSDEGDGGGAEDDNDLAIFNSLCSLDTETHQPEDNADGKGDQSEQGLESIFAVDVSLPKYVGEEFFGACIDSGAQRTVIGASQAEAYSRLAGMQLSRSAPFPLRFKFGDRTHLGQGIIQIRLPIQQHHFTTVVANIVNLDIPLLLGLDVLTQLRATIDFAEDVLSSKEGSWSLQLQRKLGHLYIVWDHEVCFTESEVQRLHKHFYHPTDDRLMALIRRAKPGEDTAETRSTVEKIRRACGICQRNAQEPMRFRVSMPEAECVFNRTVALDLMYLEGKSVLHCVDKDTRFNAAAFLPAETTRAVWMEFVRIWVNAYVGYPDSIAADQGTQFVSEEFVSLCQHSGIRLKPSGVESHNALGSGERYHSFLRQLYNRIHDSFPTMDHHHKLQTAVKAANDTAGPNGLVPTLLVFGVLPRLPISVKELPDQRSRFAAQAVAKDEMVKLSALARINKALRTNAPACTQYDIRIGDEVLAYREKNRRWHGPYKVVDVKGKSLTLNIDGKNRPFSVDKVRPFVKETNPTDTPNEGVKESQDTAQTTGTDGDGGERTPNPGNKGNEPESTKKAQDSPPDPPSEVSKHAEEIAQHPDVRTEPDMPVTFESHDEPNEWSFDSEPDQDEHPDHDSTLITTGDILQDAYMVNRDILDYYLVKIIEDSDPRASQSDFVAAKRKEADGLKRRKIWRAVKKSSLPADANVIGARFVLQVKNFQTPHEVAKARYVAQGYNDQEKKFIVHDVNLMRPASCRLIVSVAVCKGWRLFGHDVTQAYCQSEMSLTRKIYLQPKKKDMAIMGVGSDEVLELLFPLYGLCDAGDYWGVTFEKHLVNDLNMTPMKSDGAMYCWKEGDDGEICGMTGTYVDDSLNAGTDKFQEHTKATSVRFESKERVFDDFDFYGLQIRTRDPDHFAISQPYYTRNLRLTPLDADFNTFKRDRALLAWLTHSRPDLACFANRAAQVSEKTFGAHKVRELNRGVRLAQKRHPNFLSYRKLELESVHIRVYSDAAFATNDDLSSQLGFLILLADENDRCHIIEYASKKSKRVVRSIMGGETYAFMEAFDAVYSLKDDLAALLDRKLEIRMMTDSKQLFDAITRGRRTTERRLSIDITAARDAYQRFEIDTICLIAGEHNPADALSKIGGNDSLLKVMDGIDRTPIVEQIVRETTLEGHGRECESGDVG